MKACLLKLLLCLAMIGGLNAAFAQSPPLRQPVRLPSDLVAIKQMADAGSIQAQLALAKKLKFYDRCVDALAWYRKAAAEDCPDAVYGVGDMLLFGAPSPQRDQNVEPDHAEGIKWTYRAATNLYVNAFRSMSLARQRGLGVATNRAEAYAWMELYAEGDPDRGRPALEELTLRLDTSVLLEGKQIAKRFRNRQWPAIVVVGATPKNLAALKLTGVTPGGRVPLCVINRRTLAKDETGSVPVEGGTVSLKVLEIREDSAQVQVAEEAEPRWLYFVGSIPSLAGP